MNNFDEKDLLNEALRPDEPEIFGRSKSRAEIKAEQKTQRAKELDALRQARRAARQARKANASKVDLIILLVVLGLVLVFGGVLIGNSIAKENKQKAYERSETVSGYFYDDEAKPTLEKDGITAAVNEVYYTAGGYLCVNMTLGNGTDKTMSLDSLEVALSNEKDALIASGYTEAIDTSYRIEAGGYNTYTLYIKPEHIKLANDTLSPLTYQITAVGTEVEE